MATTNNTYEELTSAVCDLAEDKAVDSTESQAYADFDSTFPVEEIILSGKKLMQIEEGHEAAIQQLPEFEAKLNTMNGISNATNESIGPKKKAITRRLPWLMAAASIILFVAAAVLWIYRPEDSSKGGHLAVKDRAPGGFRATLMLSNKKSIQLEGLNNGAALHEGAVTIEKKDSATLSYINNSASSAPDGNNILFTPRAGNYHVQLSDGSMVYLNAESSLEYPVAFKGKDRVVTLTGEAYFEVAPSDKPFIVKQDANQIRVLGTKFNVNSYKSENRMVATLLEGSIRLTTESKAIVLVPSQQATVEDGKITARNLAQPENAISWVNGNFSFDKVTLKEIMNQVERWYDVSVVYEQEPDLTPITIRKIPRNVELSKFLDVLKEGDRFSYKMTEDKQKIIISK